MEYLVKVVLSLVAITITILAIKILRTIRRIAALGVEADGVIFDSEQSTYTTTNMSYPVVRFLTQKNIWITKQSKIGVIPGTYKIGKKVIVMYEGDNPENFFIKDKLTYLVPTIMIAVGLILISFVIFQLVYV